MIRGVHAMFYSSEPEALRAFLRDKLGLPHTDVGQGWLIFDLPEADLGCHPADKGAGAPSGTSMPVRCPATLVAGVVACRSYKCTRKGNLIAIH